MATDEKYLVFNRKKFDKFFDYLDLVDQEALPFPVDDARVIREQDIFAGPAFEMYAAAMTTAIRLTPAGVDVKRLTEIRDYFRECSDRAYEMASKVPD